MEARELLGRLPQPDPDGEVRVWRRFQESRARQGASGWLASLLRPAVMGPALVMAGAAAVVAVMLPERQREITLDASSDVVRHEWSEQVELRLAGHGVATGTAQDVLVTWETGTVWVEVEPHSGTSLSVVTDEAQIEVVGTAFSVTRDALGATTSVQHGTVSVTCDDGWQGQLTAEVGPHTCWPVRPAALLGRADALLERGAPGELVLATLDRGLQVAEGGSATEGELLARRVSVRASMGQVQGAVADAERYLASGDRSRQAEVARTVGRSLLAGGCEQALRWLSLVGDEGTAEDDVVLASCLLPSEPERARQLASEALQSGQPLEPAWKDWAHELVSGGGR
jgi:hypothetical protein